MCVCVCVFLPSLTPPYLVTESQNKFVDALTKLSVN